MKKIVWMAAVILSMIYFALVKMNVYAEEKEMSVPLAKDYKEAVFLFDFEDEQIHEISITSPDGSMTYKTAEDAHVEVSIFDAVKGEYVVLITAEEDITVKAMVECKNGNIAEVEANLTISSVISGLRIYFIDGDLCISWDESGIGMVNIKVTNPKNMQILDSSTVEGTVYRLKLDDTVGSEVEVNVVPAREAKTGGTGVTYTVSIVRDVSGEVELPAVSIINKNEISFDVQLIEPMTVIVTDNGVTVYAEDFDIGEHTVTTPVKDDANEMVVYLRDANYNMKSCSFTVTKDMIAPTLSMNEDLNGRTTSDSQVELGGIIQNGSKVLINNVEIETDSYGRFSYIYLLSVGENTINVCALDEAGNEAIVSMLVTRKEGRSSNHALIVFMAFLIMVFLLIGVIIKKKVAETPKKRDNTIKEVPVKDKKKETKRVFLPDEIKRTIANKRNKNQAEGNVLTKAFVKKKKAASIICGIIILASVYILMNHVLEFCHVMSESMEPTIKTGEMAVCNRLAYINHTIERGDIISFWSDEYEKSLIKRVIGLPGDEIAFYDGHVFINGMMASEEYIPEDVETNCGKTFVVPEQAVFVLGDNREVSLDSRYFENAYISIDDIKGKYIGSFKWF